MRSLVKCQKSDWIIPPFEKKIIFIILLFYNMSLEQMKSIHFCLGDITDLWYTQCMFVNRFSE